MSAQAFITYNEYFDAIRGWTADLGSELGDKIPRIIKLAEARLAIDLNLEIFDGFSTSEQTSAGSRFVNKPADHIATRTLQITSGSLLVTLRRRSYSWLSSFFEPNTLLQAIPEYFAEFDDSRWYVAPTPDQIYSTTSHYVRRPPSIVDNPGGTWLSKNCSHALFACCMMETEHFTKADDRYADFGNKYQNEYLPALRLELRELIRKGDYSPVPASAESVSITGR